MGYIGPSGGALVEALRIFSDEFVRLETTGTGPATADLDLLVLTDVPASVLRRAVPHVRMGGFVYAEFSSRRTHPWGVRRAASRAGLADVHIHWHWPDFEHCTRMVPASETGMVIHTLVKGRRGPQAALKRLVAMGLGRSGLLGWALRDFSLVARRV